MCWALERCETEVYASVSPDSAAARAVVSALGFRQAGTQQDEVYGLELVFAMRPDELR